MSPQDKISENKTGKASPENQPKQKTESQDGHTDSKTNEALQKMKIAIALTNFRQYVQHNTPYEGYVFGVGKVKYTAFGNPIVMIPDEPTPLRPSTDDNPYKDPWLWSGIGYGGFSIFTSWRAFDQFNDWWWISAKGNRISTEILNPDIFGESIKGVQGYRISKTLAGEKAIKMAKFGTKLNYVGLIIPVAHSISEGKMNTDDSSDFVFACVAFIPGVGWVVSGLYTVTDTVTVMITGEKIATHTERKLFKTWVELNLGLKAHINRFYPMYKMPL